MQNQDNGPEQGHQITDKDTCKMIARLLYTFKRSIRRKKKVSTQNNNKSLLVWARKFSALWGLGGFVLFVSMFALYSIEGFPRYGFMNLTSLFNFLANIIIIYIPYVVLSLSGLKLFKDSSQLLGDEGELLAKRLYSISFSINIAVYVFYFAFAWSGSWNSDDLAVTLFLWIITIASLSFAGLFGYFFSQVNYED